MRFYDARRLGKCCNLSLSVAKSRDNCRKMSRHSWPPLPPPPFSGISEPVVFMRVAIHENDGHHKNDENDEDNSDTHNHRERKMHINFFHINFLQPGEIGLPLCKIRRKPGFVPGFHRICPRDKLGEIPGTNPGSSQDQPDKNIYVYVPFSCLKPRS